MGGYDRGSREGMIDAFMVYFSDSYDGRNEKFDGRSCGAMIFGDAAGCLASGAAGRDLQCEIYKPWVMTIIFRSCAGISSCVNTDLIRRSPQGLALYPDFGTRLIVTSWVML